MGLRSKVLAPGLVCTLALLAIAWWSGPPGVAPAAAGAPMLLVLTAVLALLLVVLAVSVELQIRRPLAALVRRAEAAAPSPAPGGEASGEEFGRIDRGLRNLYERVARQQAELDALDERRERAEQEARLSEERLALALRGANDGLWERDLDKGRVQLSARWKGMLGYAEDELADRIETWRERIHPDDLPGVEAAVEAHLAGVTPRFERQLRLRHKDGRYRWVLSRASAVRHANGRPYRLVGLDTDVSAIKRVEYVLEQVVEGTAGTSGEDFFRSLVRHFAAALDVSCAFITECCDRPPTRVRTLAFWSAPRIVDSLEYDLAGTPCETVIREGRTCFHPTGLAAAFPVEAGFQSYIGVPIFGRDGEVLGHLAFLDQREMNEEMLVDAVFRIFAARAAAELERKAMLGRLAQQFD